MRKHKTQRTRYTLLTEITASPTEPLPAGFRRHQLTRMYQGLAALEKAERPTEDDWRVVADAVNLMETVVREGIAEDASGLLDDAVGAMARAGERFGATGVIRLDGEGIQAVRSVLADYSELLDLLPARTMYRVHRLTERRILEILSGKTRPHDVRIVGV
ncbi:hypothetical protein ACT80S_18445 [Ramlibacter sp. MAHUQ-53]|uniref:hypothetical protein n=1 Tax=unclassified Ramlibacter TaxID=2617605 RepID=UPI00363D997A